MVSSASYDISSYPVTARFTLNPEVVENLKAFALHLSAPHRIAIVKQKITKR